MDLKELYNFYSLLPRFRASQIIKAVYDEALSSWDDATTLPVEMRNELNAKIPLTIKHELSVARDKKTLKARIDLGDFSVESVLMKHKDRNTVCLSSQAGCAAACSFCLTGQSGLNRSLDRHEIVVQALFFKRCLKPENERLTNVVVMGMGEPLLNYEETIRALHILNDPAKFGIGARRMSISTVGIPSGIKALADEPLQINLALSLHAPNDKLRDQLIPMNRQYPIDSLLKALNHYWRKTSRKLMFEYLLLKGVNDSLGQARELVYLLKKVEGAKVVNIMSYNQTAKFDPSPLKSRQAFIEEVKKSGLEVVERYSFGSDIKAACGQLAENKI